MQNINKNNIQVINDNLSRNYYKFFVYIFIITSIFLIIFELMEVFLDIGNEKKYIVRAFLFIPFLLTLLDPRFISLKENNEFSLPFLFLGLLFFSYALAEENMGSGVYYSLRILFWIAGMFFVYRMLLLNILTQRMLMFLIYSIVITFSVFVPIFYFSSSSNFSQNINIYTLLWCAPFLMVFKRTFYNKVLIALTFFIIFLSFKRGAMLALVFSFIVYLFCYLFNNRSVKTTFKVVFFLLFILLFSSFSLAVIYHTRPDYFNKRTTDITGDSRSFGSGRSTFYPWLLKKYFSSFNSAPVKFYFGYGSRAVEKYMGTVYGHSLYAHSDWLQILYSYGLLGFFLFLWIHIQFIKVIRRGLIERHIHTPSLAMAYSIFFLRNIYSGVLYFPPTIYFGAFLAFYYFLWKVENQQ